MQKTVSQSDPMDGLATVVLIKSNCNANNAVLTLRWDAKSGEGADPRFITFNFSAVSNTSLGSNSVV